MLPLQIGVTGYQWATITSFILLLAAVVALFFLRKQQRTHQRKRTEQQRQETEQFRRSVLTNLTRDFRTPLTVISGAVDQLREKNGKTSTELQLIKANSERLLHLVNRLQDQSKLEAGQLSLQPEQADIINHLRQLVSSWRFQARDQKVNLHLQAAQEPVVMDFDRVRLIYIVSNMLAVAFRQTPEGGRILLTTQIDPAETQPGLFLLSVTHAPTIRQTQSATPATNSEETTFISRLINLMHGTYTMQEKPGENAVTQQLTLPITRKAPVKRLLEKPTVTPDMEETGTSLMEHDDAPLILVAEDNPDLISLLSQILGVEYNLLIARNGQEGIDLAIRHVPDIVVTDVMMPQKDGYELCYTLKHHELTSHIPIVMMSAKTGTDSRLTGLQQGADVYLEKPFQPEELEALVEAMLAQRKRLQAYYLSISGLSDEVMERPQADLQDQQENEFLQKVRQLIEDHLQEEDFSVEQLSQLLFMDTSNLYRKVKALTGLSPGQYISSLRLQLAKKLLRETSESVLSIALSCGFNSSAYFSRVFKKDAGMTPSAYRKQQQKQV